MKLQSRIFVCLTLILVVILLGVVLMSRHTPRPEGKLTRESITRSDYPERLQVQDAPTVSPIAPSPTAQVSTPGPPSSAEPSLVTAVRDDLVVQVAEPSPTEPNPAVTEPAPETDGDASSDVAPLAAFLSQKLDLSDPKKRAAAVKEVQRLERLQMEATQRKAERLGIPLVIEQPGGKRIVLAGFEGDRPRYIEDHNVTSAISIATHLVRSTAPFNLTGSGMKLGLWEATGVPRVTHQEFGPGNTRVTVVDGTTTLSDHASHVAGTILGRGASSPALGMAPAAVIDAYSSSSDSSEMLAAGAASVGEAGKIYISNHSYGFINGWHPASATWYGLFTDDGNPANDIEDEFGRYNSTSVAMDGMLYNLPYFLPFMSAGNDRSDGPPSTGGTWYVNGSSTARTYDPAQHPVGDGVYKAGYDQLEVRKVCKNVITIGATNDAVSGGVRNLGSGTLANFSSVGPADDGRIKPDVVANGVGLTSAISTSDTSYASYSGTSMATPSASGSALLLQQYYQQRFPGQAMRASTLKALIIHTADDVGRAGPDYEYGWGLMNTRAAADLIKAEADDASKQQITETTLTQGGSNTMRFRWDGLSPIRVTLCWTDPAGAGSSTHDNRVRDLVNDLNLKITAPGGSTHLPFVMPYVGDWSNAKLTALASTGVNTVDNVEQVLIASPSLPGEYVVTVDHTGSLSSGSQAYSLMVSGGVWSGLQVSPEEAWLAEGFLGGPFSPAQKVYTLTNRSGASFTWNASANASWVQVAPASGTLAAGAEVTVTVSFAGSALSLAKGTHGAEVTFTQGAKASGVVRSVSLNVLGEAPQMVVKNAADQSLTSAAITSFGSHALNTPPVDQGFKISNATPNSTLEVVNVRMSGPDADAFTVISSPLGAKLSSSTDHVPFLVRFSPQKAGAHSATLELYSNDPDQSVFYMGLSATATVVAGPAQEILVGNILPQRSNAGSFTLPAVATSGLPLTYTVVAGPATADGISGLITPTGTGAVTIQLSQAGDGSYAAATPVTVTFVLTSGTYQLKKISASRSGYFTLALDFQGRLWSWGQGSSGQLGNGSTVTGYVPVMVDGGSTWAEVSAGNSHALGIKADGSLWAWGGNTYGQVGDGTTTSRSSPILISSQRWAAISAGSDYSMAIREDGTLWGWGINTSGRIGDNSTTNRTTPVQIGGYNTWKTVSAGASHTIALKKDGTLWAWGSGSNGQLGHGGTGSVAVPIQIGSATDWKLAVIGGSHTLALKQNGTLWTWGFNSNGQLGNGTTTSAYAPAQVGVATDWQSVAGGFYHSLALKNDGSAWAWGRNSEAQIGNGNLLNQLTPVRINRVRDAWTAVTGGTYQSFALQSDFSVAGWGDGYGYTGKSARQLTHTGFAGDWREMSHTESHTLLVRSDRTLWGFGYNTTGQVGNGSSIIQNFSQIGSSSSWAKVMAGSSHSGGIQQNGSLWIWGYNANGEVGDGSTTNHYSPMPIQTGTTWLDLGLGDSHSVGVRTNGTLWAWGLNTSGQFGDGSTTSQTTPTQVGSETAWSKVIAGSNSTLAIKSNGTLWAAGSNASGQLGVGDTTPRTTWTQVGSATDWAQLAANTFTSFGIKTDGSLWAWGLNSSGQLGLGDTMNRNSPTRVGIGYEWAQISCGGTWTAAVKTDGTLWAWGNNTAYQQGLTIDGSVSSPRQIGNAGGWIGVQAGNTSIVARRVDGSLWTAGFTSGFRLTSGGGRSPFVIAPVLPGLQPQSILPLPQGFHSGRIQASSGLPVQLEIISGSGTVNGDQFTHTGAVGSTTVVMAWQRGDETAWNAALPTQFSITTQAIDFPVIAQQTCGTPLTLNATASSGLPVSYSITSGANLVSLQDGVLTFIAAGTVTLQASQVGGNGYAAAEPVSRTFNVVKGAQVLTFAESVPTMISYIESVALAAASDRGLTPVTFSVVSGPGEIEDDELNFLTPGTVVVKAAQTGDDAFLAAEAEITIEAFNNAPVAQANSFSGNEDNLIIGQVQGTDAQNTPLSYAVVTGPAHGQLSLNTDGGFSYVPDANYHGSDNFTFKANDGLVDSEPATISFTIASVNDAPVAFAVFMSTPDSVPLSMVLAGMDADQDDLTFDIVDAANHGQISGTMPNITYVSDPGYSGLDTFTFTVSDGAVVSAPAMISIQVSAVGITFVRHPQFQKVSETGMVTLDVEVKGTNPITYQWMKGDAELEGKTSRVLELSSLVEADSGLYRVRVTNPVETVDSLVANLQVIGGQPEVVVQPQHQLKLVGDDVEMSVTALGKPPLTYQWRKNGKVIRGETQATLSLPAVQLTDAAAYSVAVTATTTTVSDIAEVGVAESFGKHLFVAEEGKTSWAFKTAGNELTHAWLHEGNPLPDNVVASKDGKKVTLTDAETENAGRYICVVTGPGGSVEAGEHILWVVDRRPDITPLKSGDALPRTIVGEDYEFEVPYDNDPHRVPSLFAASGLPPGLSIDPLTGVISGRVSGSKTVPYAVKITASNARGSEAVDVSLFVEPFPAVGTYVAWLPRHAFNDELGGRLDLVTTSSGGFSGKLSLGSRKVIPYKGGLLQMALEEGSQPTATLEIPQPSPLPPLLLSVTLNPETDLMDGSLFDGNTDLEFGGWRHAWSTKGPTAGAWDGLYNLGLQPELRGGGRPEGTGFASVTVATSGAVKVAGKTADGEALTASGVLGPQGQVMVHQLLYKTKLKGSLTGIIQVDPGDDSEDDADNTLAGDISWSRPESSGRVYAEGFTALNLTAVGQRYLSPVSPEIVLGLVDEEDNAVLAFTGAGVEGTETSPDISFQITTKHKLLLGKAGTEANPYRVTLKLDPKKGLLSGSLTLTDPGPAGTTRPVSRKVNFEGLIYDDGSGVRGRGYFLLPQLQESAAQPANSTPILSGEVELKAP